MEEDKSADGLPAQPPSDPAQGEAGETRTDVRVTIGSFTYQGNDLTEFRKLAEADPELAREVVATRDRTDAREHMSERIGMITAGVLALALFIAAAVTFIYLGFWQSVAAVAALLSISHVLRVVLTGEWSDTSWFGRILQKEPGTRNGDQPK